MVIVFCPALESLMEALFVSIGVVALAEIGDKTQLLAFILAARFKKPIVVPTDKGCCHVPFSWQSPGQ